MSDLKKTFDAAAADSKNLSAALGDDVKLRLYGLFKQAGAGDVTGSRPGFADFVGRAKYDAWAAVKGTGAGDAMQQYIGLVESLRARGGRAGDAARFANLAKATDADRPERKDTNMQTKTTIEASDATRSLLLQRLARCYSRDQCDWSRIYRPRYERANMATRYHLVYPALAYYLLLKEQPALADQLRPQLNAMYRGLLDPRCWSYWHTELKETTWPLQERNLTYAGRLATFVGFYIDAFGEPPSERIDLDGRSISYSALSEGLWRQGTVSPNRGVSCYHHQSMVMCNAHLLINNVLHDRLFGTDYASSNQGWLRTLDEHLVRKTGSGPLFYYGTKANDIAPEEGQTSKGADIWALFLMSGVIPERVRAWFDRWRGNITHDKGGAFVEVTDAEARYEISSNLLATSWAFCLAKELGDAELAALLRRTLDGGVVTGFDLDPLLSGLVLLGESVKPGSFRRLVAGEQSSSRDRLV